MNMYRKILYLELNVKFVLPVFSSTVFIRKAYYTCSTGNVLWPGATAQLFFTLTTFQLQSGERHQTRELTPTFSFMCVFVY